MRLSPALPLTALLAAAAASAPAHAQMFVTSVTAAFPDSKGKVPGLNLVPGAGIPNWSNGLAQAVLTHGQYYNYCVSLASATADGSATVIFKLTRAGKIIQTHRIIGSQTFKVGSNGVWYYCSGYLALPSSPGPATLWGQVQYYPTGSQTPIFSRLAVPVVLQ